MVRCRSVLSRLRTEESGVSIIEVLVSAVLVAMIAVGVLKGLDAANAASGNSKSRAIAADLASQDQERMRAFKAKNLSNMNVTNPKTVAGVTYQVTSTAQWINDGSGSRRCGQATGRADYLRISSSVTWPNMRGAGAVTQTSLYAPPNGSFGDEGSLGVEVLDRNAVGVPGVSVSATGPANVSGTTDASGCVFFAFLPKGNYTTTISKPGHVDRQGRSVLTAVFGVEGGSTQVQPVDYDLAGAAQVSIRARRGAGTPDLAAAANYLSFGHSALDSPNVRLFGNGTPASSFTAAGLFPFTSPYSVYSGNCVGAAPPTLLNPPTPPPVTITPGGSAAVAAREIAVRIKSYGSYVGAGTTIKMYPKGTGCSGTITLTTVTGGWIQAPSPSTDPGVPYGTYDVCGQASGYRSMVTGRAVNNVDGVEIDLGSSAVQGNCP